MTSIFDMFSVNTKGKFSPFTGSPKQNLSPGNPDVGEHPNAITNAVMAAFNRIPLWFSSVLVPSISPTIESSLYYPLNFQAVTISENNANGTKLLQPPPGKHWMVTSLYFESANNAEIVTLRLGNGTTNNIILAKIATSVSTLPNVGIPFIGGMTYPFDGTNGSAGIIGRGMNPIYVTSSVFLSLSYTALAVTRRFDYSYLELPENQPFGNLLGMM